MALRGKKPEERTSRLKLLLSGPAGVGKTTAAIQMPKPYIIDTEHGSTHYGKLIETAGGVVYESTDITDVIREVKALMQEQHDFLTVVIDPITPLFDAALDEGEKKVGTEFGRHYGYANKMFKRLCNLLTEIDMNVVITSHEKVEYETVTNDRGKKEMVKGGLTYDGYKKLDYVFDLYLQLSKDKKTGQREAYVAKTRLEEFPDMNSFPWNYDEIRSRFGKDRLEKGVSSVALATPDQIKQFNFLLTCLNEQEITNLKIDKAIASVDDLSDMASDRISKGITIMEQYIERRDAK